MNKRETRGNAREREKMRGKYEEIAEPFEGPLDDDYEKVVQSGHNEAKKDASKALRIG